MSQGFLRSTPVEVPGPQRASDHLIEAIRGKRLNVLAAMLSTGDLFSASYWQTTTAEVFAGFLDLLREKVGKPLIVILDNASIHRAKLIQPAI